jgi:hypothetical protein
MAFSGILLRVTLVRTDVSEERIISIIRVTRIGELGTLAVTRNQHTLPRLLLRRVLLCSMRRLLVTESVMPSSPILVILTMEAKCSSETSVLTRATRRYILEDGVLHSHRRENLKSYIELAGFVS